MKYAILIVLCIFYISCPCSASVCFGLTRKLIATVGEGRMQIKTAVFSDVESPARPEVFLLSMQPRLETPTQVDSIKHDLLNGTFDYEKFENRVGGYYNPRTKVFYISEGNHRLAAALEVAKETGNWASVKKLLSHGNWDETNGSLTPYYGINTRKTLWDSFSWRKFLGPVSPTSRDIRGN